MIFALLMTIFVDIFGFDGLYLTQDPDLKTLESMNSSGILLATEIMSLTAE